MKHGLIVGGTSEWGIGHSVRNWLEGHITDENAEVVRDPEGLRLFPKTHWHVPTPKELDVSRDEFIDTYVANMRHSKFASGFDDFAGFDYVVYSAGVNSLNWAHEISMDDLSAAFRVNVFGFVKLLGSLRKTWPKRPFSAVAIVSDAMRNPMRGSIAYCTSKAAMAMAVKCLAREWAPDCRINGIAPGVVAGTTMSDYIDRTVPDFRGWTTEQAAQYELSMQPMGRRVQPTEVAELVGRTLAGPEYLTGSIIEITGAK